MPFAMDWMFVTPKFMLKAPDPDVSVWGDGACEEVISLMRSSGWNPNGTGQVPWEGEEETPALFGSMHTRKGRVGCSKKTVCWPGRRLLPGTEMANTLTFGVLACRAVKHEFLLFTSESEVFCYGTSAEGRLSEEPLLDGHPVHVHGERNVMPAGLKNPRSEPLSNTEEHPVAHTPRLCRSVATALTASGCHTRFIFSVPDVSTGEDELLNPRSHITKERRFDGDPSTHVWVVTWLTGRFG